MAAIFLTPGDDTVSYTASNDPVEVYGLGGNDNITGGNNSDLLDGGEGNDILKDFGGFGHDRLVGGVGDDGLSARAGNDWLEGGDNNDVLEGGSDHDRLDGGAGDDVLRGDITLVDDGGPGDETGDDVLDGGVGWDRIFGFGGNDTIIADGSFANAADQLDGGTGDDVYSLGGLNVTIADSGGLDRIEAAFTFSLAGFGAIEDLTLAGAASINGAGNGLFNQIIGNDAGNTLDGAAGADVLRGRGGNDLLIAGQDGVGDSLYGGLGDDVFIVAEQENLFESGGEGRDTVRSSVSLTLHAAMGEIEVLVLEGTAANATGNGLDNTIQGNVFGNSLNGGVGYDTLIGGSGGDNYWLQDISARFFRGNYIGDFYDSVQEASASGVDTIFVGRQTGALGPITNYTLDANVENGAVTGIGDFDLQGNTLANALAGSSARNTLSGDAGNDTLNGGAESDTLAGGTGDDTYQLDDVTARFFQGNYIGDFYDRVQEAADAGTDTIRVGRQNTQVGPYTLDANVENGLVTGTGAFDLFGNTLRNTLTGNEASNTLVGGDGNDTLNGGAGYDVLIGEFNDDVYLLGDVSARFFQGTYIGDFYDSVQEGAGAGLDAIYVGRQESQLGPFTSYALDANVENGIVTGAAAFDIAGNELDNGLTGNGAANGLDGGAGNDVLDGRGGADSMAGRIGNDWFYVDHAGDTVNDGGGEGALDRVFASANYVLNSGAEIEIISTTSHAGTSAIRLTGNALGQTVYGNAGDNHLNGGGGTDTLVGFGGNDWFFVDSAADAVVEAAGAGTADRVFASVSYALAASTHLEILSTNTTGGTSAINLTGNAFANTVYGNNGANIINGGAGNDTLQGLGGADAYLFNSALNAATNVDAIIGYSVSQNVIRLDNAIFTGLANGALAAGAFRVGTGAADADDRIVYNTSTGALIFDSNGVASGGSTQFATLSPNLAMTAAEFFVV